MKRTIFVILLAVTALTLISCSKSTAADDSPLGIPEFNPAPGSYGEPVSVLIHCATHGAEIRYTTDGSFPTVDSQLYTGLIPINTDTHFKARAFMPGRPPSPVVSADYIFSASAVEAVSLSPAGGFYQQSFTLSMSCATPDAEIRYTLNEADPDQNSLLYSTPILIDGSVTVKAKAFVEGMIPSLISTANYVMQLTDPIFSLASGSYAESQYVSISHANSDAQIRYTIDGSDPDESSMLYTRPLSLSINTLVKAKAYSAGWEPSNVVQSFYIINLPDQMQLVQGGTFHNGTAQVTLDAYYIGRREVTQLEWDYIMLNLAEIETEKPITEISWADAIEYCNYRSIAEGFTPCYSYSSFGNLPALWPENWADDSTLLTCSWTATGYRLPTEMEWMYAARGGWMSQDYVYSGSDVIDDVAWYAGNSSAPEAVGTKNPNELGIYDMSGNVWEFCWDFYDNQYSAQDSQNPHGPATGLFRVMRGGSFNNDPSNCTVARRFYTPAILKADFHGFRVVRRSL